MTEGLDVGSTWPPPPPVTPSAPAVDAPERTAVVGVRCPGCGLGGDIDQRVVQTVCPSCATVFAVATALAPRPPAAGAAPPPPPPTTHHDRPRPGPSTRRAPTAVESTTPVADARVPSTAGLDGLDGTDAAAAPNAARTRLLIAALAVFVVGVLVGWLLGRNGDDGAADSPRDPATSELAREAARTGDTDAGTRAPGDRAGAAAESTPPTGGTAATGATSPTAGAPDRPAGPVGAAGTSGSAASRELPSTFEPSLPQTTTTVPTCSELDCRMTGEAQLYRVPLPDDASAVGADDGIAGWITRVASVEELTGWYREYLTDHGWRLLPTYSVLDPTAAAGRDLGHATSAIYCRRGDDPAAIAVNIGWPASDSTGETVVMAIVGSPRPITC